jgi:hypothetical protein
VRAVLRIPSSQVSRQREHFTCIALAVDGAGAGLLFAWNGGLCGMALPSARTLRHLPFRLCSHEDLATCIASRRRCVAQTSGGGA